MTLQFGYDKKKVIQALRYHFISRREIRLMLVLVNVFALLSMTLYVWGKVTGFAFIIGSFLWIVLLISFWFVLPFSVYRRAVTFRHEFEMDFDLQGFTLRHQNGSRKWEWSSLKSFVESPHFFHLYFDSRSFILVPKDACRGIDQTQELRELIRSKIVKVR